MRPRNVVILLLLLALAIPIGIAGLLLFVDLDAYKPTIEAKVEQALDRKVAIVGDIRVLWSLHPTLRIDDVRVANPAWASRPELVRIARLQVQISALPLLAGRVEVQRVTVEGADLQLETGPGGERNWLSAPEAKGASQATPRPSPAASAAQGDKRLPVVREVRLIGSHVTYRDDRSGHHYDLTVGRLSLSETRPDGPIRLKGKGQVEGLDVGIGGTVGPLQALLRSSGPAPVSLSLETAGLTVSLDGQLGPAGADGTDLVVSAQGPGLAALERLVSPDSVAQRLLAGTGPLSLRAEITGQLGHPAVSGISARALMGGVELKASGSVADAASLRGIALQLSAEGQPGSLAAALPGLLSADLPLSAQVAAQGDARRLRLTGLALHVGDSDLAGELTIATDGGRPRIDGTLQSHRLDLEALRGVKSVGQGPVRQEKGSGGGKGRVFSDKVLDLGALRALDGTIKAHVDELRLGGMAIANLDATADLERGALKVAPLAAEVAGGKVGGSLGLDADDGTPRVDLAMKGQGLDLGMLLAALAPQLPAEGRAALDVDLHGAGRSPAEIAGTLAGRADLAIGAGRVRVDLLQRLPGQASVVTKALLGDTGQGWVRYACGVADLKAAQGVAHIDRLVVQGEKSTLSGSGEVDLGKERPDVTIVGTSTIKGVALGVPVHIGGTLEDPKVELSSQSVVEGLKGIIGGLAGGGGAGEGSCAAAASAPAQGATDPAARPEDRAIQELGRQLKGLLGR